MDINLFFDMDGVLAEYDPDTVNKMYDEGFFLNRPPMEGTLRLIKRLLKENEYNIYILSTIMADSIYTEPEKHKWLDKYLPELPIDKRLFVNSNDTKDNYIKNHVPNVEKSLNILFDDYSHNLWSWVNSGFIGIKILNGVNNTNQTWISTYPNMVINSNDRFKFSKLKKLIEG